MPDLPAKPSSSRVSEFLKRATATARIAFIIDATGSREVTWDLASKLQNEMFEQVAKLGALEVQLIFYRGPSEVSRSPWLMNGASMALTMSKIHCRTGLTQIARALNVVREENQKQKIAAAVFIGDAMEEDADALCVAASSLGVQLFMFQEGDDPEATRTFIQMARVSGGAHCRFEAGAARQLAEYLRAAAVFATGGKAALTSLNSSAARLMLGQMK